jgi:hypothetical protein
LLGAQAAKFAKPPGKNFPDPAFHAGEQPAKMVSAGDEISSPSKTIDG